MKKIVILGGGFAGLNLAKRLSKKADHQVIVVDRNNYHFFPPLLYQVGTAFIESSNISYPFRKMFHSRNIKFFMGELVDIDPIAKKLNTDNGTLDYDILVLAMGTETNFFGNRQVEKYALPMKTIDDALELRNHVLLQLEKSVRASSIEDRIKHSNIVIAGGGPTGVELAGMLAEMGRNIISKDYPEADVWPGKIFLIDGLQTLLAPMSIKSQKEALAVLKKLGVEILLGKLVQDYDGDKVSLSDGTEIFSSTLIWASGVVARKVKGIPETSLGRGRRILVDEFNRVSGLQDVFAIGDQCFQTTDAAFPNGHPQLAQVAIQQGNHLGKNLNNGTDENMWNAFKYNDKGSMAIISKFRAVVDLPNGFFKGFFAWLVWLFIHIIPIAGFRNKVKLAFNWLWSFLTNDPTLRLIVRPTGQDEDIDSVSEKPAV